MKCTLALAWLLLAAVLSLCNSHVILPRSFNTMLELQQLEQNLTIPLINIVDFDTDIVEFGVDAGACSYTNITSPLDSSSPISALLYLFTGNGTVSKDDILYHGQEEVRDILSDVYEIRLGTISIIGYFASSNSSYQDHGEECGYSTPVLLNVTGDSFSHIANFIIFSVPECTESDITDGLFSIPDSCQAPVFGEKLMPVLPSSFHVQMNVVNGNFSNSVALFYNNLTNHHRVSSYGRNRRYTAHIDNTLAIVSSESRCFKINATLFEVLAHITDAHIKIIFDVLLSNSTVAIYRGAQPIFGRRGAEADVWDVILNTSHGNSTFIVRVLYTIPTEDQPTPAPVLAVIRSTSSNETEPPPRADGRPRFRLSSSFLTVTFSDYGPIFNPLDLCAAERQCLPDDNAVAETTEAPTSPIPTVLYDCPPVVRSYMSMTVDGENYIHSNNIALAMAVSVIIGVVIGVISTIVIYKFNF